MQVKVEQELPVKLMVLISLVQGLLLLWLHQAIELKFWPHQSPHWLFGFYAMALAGPVMLLLGLSSGKERDWFKWAAVLTLLVGLCGVYVGFQATPIEHIRFGPLLFAMIHSLVLAVFKAQMYTQQKIEGGEYSYANLFRWSWRNFLTLSLALLFAAAFWGILMLWAELFKTIKIDFFHDLFTERWFYYPAIALALGFGVIMFRRLTHVIDMITRLQQALMKYLLVILVFVAIIFLASLALTGLDSLWEKGGSQLILCMQALILFFVNAVYQDDADARPYHPLIHNFIYLGVLALPIYSLISFYGLTLRIDQYGWSVARCWGMLIWLFLAIFSFGYAWGIVKHRDSWLQPLSKINVVVGILFMVAMLLVNSPVLDFRKITVNSQLALLESGSIELKNLDVYYFRRELARPGYESLQSLSKKYAATNPEFVSRVSRAYSGYGEWENLETKEQFIASLVVANKSDVPDDLINELYQFAQKSHMRDFKARYLIELELNGDQQPEYLFVHKGDNWPRMMLFSQSEDHWQQYDVDTNKKYSYKFGREFYDALNAGDFQLVQPKWTDIEVNGVRLRVKPN
jgi:hypothetical protein